MSHSDHVLPVDPAVPEHEHHPPPIRSASARPPTAHEMAAIVAAVELAWPRPVVVTEEAPKQPVWRFSGRWWLPRKPVAANRIRP